MSIRVVVVDDAPFIREVIRSLLESERIEVVGEAIDGLEAIEIVHKTKPDLVLMDIVMPQKNGIEATRSILENFPEMRILALSTADHQALVLQALDAGCCGFLLKPFEAAQLLRAIRTSLKKPGD